MITLIDILFYGYVLMALQLLAIYFNTLLNWLLWYPPNLRGMRAFRLRRFFMGLIVWCAAVLPVFILYERSRKPNPLMGVQRAASGNSTIFF